MEMILMQNPSSNEMNSIRQILDRSMIITQHLESTLDVVQKIA
jgi:hypothetical protein